MQILVNNEPVDALSMLVHRQRAEGRGRAMVEKMKELIPPHMFQISDPGRDRRQGDRARDRARLAQGRHREMLRRRHHAQAQTSGEKQKEGKKKMRQFGKVDIPQEAFIAALKVDS